MLSGDLQTLHTGKIELTLLSYVVVNAQQQFSQKRVVIFFLTSYFSWLIFPSIFFRGRAKVKDVASKFLKAAGALMFGLTSLTASSWGSGSETDVWG